MTVRCRGFSWYLCHMMSPDCLAVATRAGCAIDSYVIWLARGGVLASA